jgi:hypothetical protein
MNIWNPHSLSGFAGKDILAYWLMRQIENFQLLKGDFTLSKQEMAFVYSVK